MKALITKTSSYRYKKVKEINSIDDLKKIADAEDTSLVINFNPWGGNYDITVEIYDDYRE